MSSARFELLETGLGQAQREAFLHDVRAGLLAPRKALPCRWFYDAEGTQLFEQICTLEEYYVPRAETEILLAEAEGLAARMPAGTALLELGGGDARKTRILIEACLRRQAALEYLSLDISRTALERSSRALLAEYPRLSVRAVHGEYGAALARLDAARLQPKLVLWLGSNIGNFDRAGAAAFLGRIAGWMGPADRLLVGVDLRKPRAVLEAAYDDARGLTARFNLNLLARINRELGGRFDLARFAHRARYHELEGRIEMHLVSSAAQRVAIEAAGLEVEFLAGEAIHTEDSYKYSPAEIEATAAAAGLELERAAFDSGQRFCLALLAPRR